MVRFLSTLLLLSAIFGPQQRSIDEEFLKASGAQINAQDPEGNTPLLIATRAGSMSGVAFLISKGARIDMPNKAGETALKIAKRIHENKKVYNAALVEERIVGMFVAAGAKE